MRIPALTAILIAFAACAAAQCPVSGDASACTTPTTTPGPSQPSAGKAAKPVPSPGKAPAKAPAPALPMPSNATQSITRTQADAILVELKEIHALLQKQQPATPAIDFSKFDFQSFLQVKLAADGRWDNGMGKDDAPVTMVEFSDYQCSHCARFHSEVFEAIKKKYIDSGKVRFVSRDLPLPFHPWAMIAAEASRCAGEQQKYWQMHDALMRRSEELSPAVIEQVAQAIPLDMGLYHACTESRKYYTSVREDEVAAMAAQIPATPGFVIGKNVGGVTEGKRVMGALPLEQFEKLIEEALAQKP